METDSKRKHLNVRPYVQELLRVIIEPGLSEKVFYFLIILFDYLAVCVYLTTYWSVCICHCGLFVPVG